MRIVMVAVELRCGGEAARKEDIDVVERIL